MSVVYSQASEVLPSEEWPFLEDDRKLPAIVHKMDVDKSVDGDSTELDIDAAVDSSNTDNIKSVTQNDNKASPRRKNERKLKLNCLEFYIFAIHYLIT